MNIIKTLLSFRKIQSKSLSAILGSLGLGTLLISLIFKNKNERHKSFQEFLKQSVSLLALRGVSQVRTQLSNKNNTLSTQHVSKKKRSLWQKIKQRLGFSSSSVSY